MSASYGFLFLSLSAALAGSACAVNSPSPKFVTCKVVNAGKLPASAGTADSICAAIAAAAASGTQVAPFSVEVRVIGPSALAAILTTARGKRLPEQKLAASDHPLTPHSIAFFAKSLVATARAAGR